jgi:hypothetical protein
VNSTRFFTPAEANRTLPLVRRIVRDILEAGQRMRDLATAGLDETGRDEMDRLEDEVTSRLEELRHIGCDFKDWSFEVGLVDFPARLGDRDVLLCWRSDEPAVLWYHEVDAGFAGRRPIPAHLLEDEVEPMTPEL